MPESTSKTDVLVVGAGPAGCTAATVLAQHGHDVTVLERERFPRYRIGESLIPHCWYALDRIGLADQMDESGFTVPKYSVQFVSTSGQRSKPYYFFEHTDHVCSRTWQVVREKFDRLLVDNARAKGVTVLEETAAKELVREDGRVVGVTAERGGEPLEIRAKVTIDASGRDIFAQSKNRWRVSDENLNKVALWTYYRNAMRDPGYDEGATTVAYLPDKGWFWYLPLADDLTSVGIVAEPDYLFGEERDHAAIFEREVAKQPWIAEHLAPGTPTGQFKVTRDFSYRSRFCADDGLVLVGDAFSFLDPVFSSGVFFALHGGVLAGDAIDAALRAGDVSAKSFEAYGEKLCADMEAMRRLVHAFYDKTFNFGAFLKAHPDLRGDVTDVLIGEVDRDFGPLFGAMAEFAQIPDPLPHGRAATAQAGDL